MQNDILLGKITDYPKQYSPDVLYAIPRAKGREHIVQGVEVTTGYDCWHAFEVSWLDVNHKPKVAIARVMVPADSDNIVESKSLKLYFNSLNFTSFASEQELIEIVQNDLLPIIGKPVIVSLIAVDDMDISNVVNANTQLQKHAQNNTLTLIDDCDLTTPMTKLLQMAEDGSAPTILKHCESDEVLEEALYSHILRTNCPVTNQPDWGSIAIRYEGAKIDQASLLTYLCSYREHNGFHEQCVEQIFADIIKYLQPKKLMVQAWYTRRGGIDINPVRATHSDWLPEPSRVIRQ